MLNRVRLIALAGTVVLGAAAGCYIVMRTQRPVALSLPAPHAVAAAGPLEVRFSQDIAPGFSTTIRPALAGSWQPHGSVLGVSATTFQPAVRFEPGRRYTLHFTHLKRAVTGAPLPDFTETFTAQSPAAIKVITPAGGAANVPIAARFTVTLAGPNRGVRDLRPTLTPAAPLKLVSSNDTTFIWTPVTQLKQGTSYTFTLNDAYASTAATRVLATVPFTTVTPPTIVSARTGGDFAPGQTIDIVFDQLMDSGAGHFVFDFKGSGVWADPHTYRFTPSNLAVNTTYTYHVKSGLRAAAGGFLEADHDFSFATDGAVVASLSPGGGGVSVGSPLTVAFDQAVDHASAQSHLSLSPAVPGKFSWSGNTLTFQPSAKLNYQSGYSYVLTAGVTPVWGLPSTQVFRGSFTTENQIVKLNVPAYKQQYPMSCELSSLRMLLAFRGIFVSDYDILMRIGYNPHPFDAATNSWDNPNVTYVGDINQAVFHVGYGVHSGPVAAAARSYGRNATSQFGINAQFIAQNIYAGNPVEFYGHITPTHPDSWNTPQGVADTTSSMHARVAYGVVGSADNPVGFYVNDPYTGGSSYWTTAQVLATMNAALPASNQAVVVF